MVTTIRGGQANYTVANGGSVPAGMHIRDIGKFARDLAPRKTPLLTRVGMGAPINVYQPEWGNSRIPNIKMSLGSNLGDNGGVSGYTGAHINVTVGAGQGVDLQRNSVLEVIDYFVGTTTLNYATRELIYLREAASGDTVNNVYRGYGGTTAQSHLTGAQVMIHSVAEPQLSTHAPLAVRRGIVSFNEFQRFSDELTIDRATQNTQTYEFPDGNPKAYDMANKVQFLKYALEAALWNGGRQAGSQANPPVPSMMGGIDTFITTNVTNANGAKLDARALEAELRRLWKTVDDNAGKTLLMDFDTASIFDGWGNASKMVDQDDTKRTYLVNKVQFREGVYDIAVSRNCPPATIYIVNLDDIKVHPRKGCDWTMQLKDGNVHNVANDTWGIFGDFTCVVKNENAMAKLYNFNTDAAAYPINW